MSDSAAASAKYLVLGTAGHIDHGKTSLIRALTGIDCDTMAEEKSRGITINLGFAHFTLPDGTRLGIVDVPGHKRFIRNMVAGAVGIDLVLLVIAADDGVMPQTREHLSIARLLGVRHGLVALTKIDMVDEELRELALADVEELIAPTFLAGCPIIPVSSTTGEGMELLIQALTDVAARVKPRALGDRFRMPVDRSFSVKGAGTVVTGTALAGSVKVDDELELLPAEVRARVRGIQVHGESVKSIGPGHRTALNLVGVEKDQITRGDVLVSPGSLETTLMFDAEVDLLPEMAQPLHAGSEVLLHIGTTEQSAKVYPLDEPVLSPGMNGFIQLRLSEKAVVAAGDRFILRASTAEATIGGGRVLDPHPMKHRRQRGEAAEKLAELADRDADALSRLVHEAGKSPYGLYTETALKRLNASEEQLAQTLAEADAAQVGLRQYQEGRRIWLALPVHLDRISGHVLEQLEAYHAASPLQRKGLGQDELLKSLRSKTAGIPAELVRDALERLVAEGRLAANGQSYALPLPPVELSPRDQQAISQILRELNSSAAPPQLEEFGDTLAVKRKRAAELLGYLLERGDVTASEGLYFGRERLEAVHALLRAELAGGKGIGVGQFNQLAGTSRKYGLPLLHWLEQNGILRRDGDLRYIVE